LILLRLFFLFIFICATPSVFALKALSENLRCDVHFFEAHFNYPQGYDKKNDAWVTSEDMRKVLAKAPLSAYTYFKKIETARWHLTLLKPMRQELPFLARYELTYLEARITSLGQSLYRFEHKVGHRNSVEFSVDALEPTGIFIQRAVTHDQFLHLLCVPE
jgi:hypothetical protein